MKPVSDRRKRNILLYSAVLIVVIACLLPYIAAARYAIFHYDDFYTYDDTIKQAGDTYFQKSIAHFKQMYMTWQGTYTYDWVSSYFDPLRWGYENAYTINRIFLMGGLLLTAAAALWTFIEADKSLKLGGKGLLFFAVIFIPFVSYRSFCEIYAWFVGAVNYLMPLFFLLTALALMFRADRKKSVPLAVLACISCFLAAGGVLCIGAFGACILLLCLSTDFAGRRKVKNCYLFPFCVTVAGDLMNCLAPGNFAKYELGSGTGIGGNVTNAVKYAVLTAAEDYADLFGGTTFIVFLLCAFLLGWVLNKKIKTSQYLIILAAAALTPVITIFPMVLGYNGFGLEIIGNRGLFCLDMSIMFSTELAAAATASKLKSSGILKNKRLVPAVCAALMLLTLAVHPGSIKASVPVQITQNLANGKIQAYSSGWHEIFDNMYSSPGQDIIIVEVPEVCVGVKEFQLLSNPDSLNSQVLMSVLGCGRIYTGYYLSQHPEVLK